MSTIDDYLKGYSDSEVKPKKFDLSAWLSKHNVLISFIVSLGTILVALLGFIWLIHQELSEQSEKIGRLEGQMEILLEDRREINETKMKILENELNKIQNNSNEKEATNSSR